MACVVSEVKATHKIDRLISAGGDSLLLRTAQGTDPSEGDRVAVSIGAIDKTIGGVGLVGVVGTDDRECSARTNKFSHRVERVTSSKYQRYV